MCCNGACTRWSSFGWPQSEDGKWNKFGGRLAWDKSAICCNNPAFGGTGSAKTGEDYVAAPNIDHTQVRVEGPKLNSVDRCCCNLTMIHHPLKQPSNP